MNYTKNHQLSLRGKTNDFTKKDLLDIAKLHSLKENIAKEIIEQTMDIFSTFRNRASFNLHKNITLYICPRIDFLIKSYTKVRENNF